MKVNGLLVITPHFKLFIKDQVTALSHFFDRTTVVVPCPYFPKFMLNIPYVEERLLFIKSAMESCNKSMHYGVDVLCPKFFTLPLEALRKRVPMFIAKTIFNELRRRKVDLDLVHCHRLDVGFSGALIKDVYGKPFVVTCHGSDAYDFPFRDSFRRSIAKYVIARADQIIAVCKSDAEKLISLGLPPKKLSIIPNGFDDSLFKPVPQRVVRGKLGIPSDKKVLLTVGTLHEIKGHVYLIDAIKILSKSRNDLMTIVIGSGPMEMKLRKKVKRLGLEGKVLFLGWVPHNRIPLWMSASDVFVLPSLNEGLPTVIPEAMACGKPTVGTRVGGIPDIINTNEVGVLVKAGDSEDLAQGILEALNKKWNSKRIRDYAQKYSLKTITNQILQVYENVSSL